MTYGLKRNIHFQKMSSVIFILFFYILQPHTSLMMGCQHIHMLLHRLLQLSLLIRTVHVSSGIPYKKYSLSQPHNHGNPLNKAMKCGPSIHSYINLLIHSFAHSLTHPLPLWILSTYNHTIDGFHKVNKSFTCICTC